MKKTSKGNKATETATVASKGPKVAKAKPRGAKFNGDWSTIPSGRMLLALVIRSIETGVPMGLPTTREAAIAALGYDKKEYTAKAA